MRLCDSFYMNFVVRVRLEGLDRMPLAIPSTVPLMV